MKNYKKFTKAENWVINTLTDKVSDWSLERYFSEMEKRNYDFENDTETAILTDEDFRLFDNLLFYLFDRQLLQFVYEVRHKIILNEEENNLPDDVIEFFASVAIVIQKLLKKKGVF